MKSCLQPRTRTPIELAAGLGRYLFYRYRGEAAIYPNAKRIAANFYRPLEQLLAEQDAAIVRVVNHAYNNSPYYRRKYDAVGFKPGDVKGRADLAMLPEISKTELSQNTDEILTMPRDQLERSVTGGTSGVQLTYYRTRETSDFRHAIDLVVPRYYGWRDGQWQGWLWGATRDMVQPSSFKSKIAQNFGNRTFFFEADRMDVAAYRHFAARVKKYRPTYVSAYPALAYDLADRIASGEVDPVRIPMISLTAEPTYDFQRKMIGEYLADEVFERYGSRECGMAALECPAHTGLHTFTESVFFETVSHGPDIPGSDLLVTDLLNLAMPIIRYHTGDLADIDDAPCECGRSQPRLYNIQGRETETIWRADGSGVAGPVVAAWVGDTEIRAPLQVVQESLNRIVLRIECPTDEYDAELQRYIDRLRREIGDDITYDVQHVERIERAASGKYRYVISKVTRKQAQGDGGHDAG